jgi:hypothetical protein
MRVSVGTVAESCSRRANRDETLDEYPYLEAEDIPGVVLMPAPGRAQGSRSSGCGSRVKLLVDMNLGPEFRILAPNGFANAARFLTVCRALDWQMTNPARPATCRRDREALRRW